MKTPKPKPVVIDWAEVDRLLEEHERNRPEHEKRAREAKAREQARKFRPVRPSKAVEELRKLYLRRPLE